MGAPPSLPPAAAAVAPAAPGEALDVVVRSVAGDLVAALSLPPTASVKAGGLGEGQKDTHTHTHCEGSEIGVIAIFWCSNVFQVFAGVL